MRLQPSPRIRALGGAFGLLAALASLRAARAQPSLVADIGDGVPATLESLFGGLPSTVVVGGTGYFLNNDGVHGRELWRSDGSAPGTQPVADLCPGACGSAWLLSTRGLAATGAQLFFSANDGVHGEELWASDGTAAGTRLVADLAPGLRSSGPGHLTAVGSRVFFTAVDALQGSELWVSDGTAAGTALVVDLAPGTTTVWLGVTGDLGGALVYGPGNGGLWRSDGTAAGTFQLTTTRPWQQSWSAGAPFAVLGGSLLFWGDDDDGTWDPTLWVSDGTVAGTHELAPISDPSGFVLQGPWLYFSGDAAGTRGLYRTDGTAAGTVPIPLPPGTEATPNFGFQAAGSSLVYFGARDAAHGQELWATDGASAWLVTDIRPGPDWGLVANYGPLSSVQVPALTALGDRALFFADDGVHGREPWTSDGTAAGTQLLADLTLGSAGTLSDSSHSLLPQTVVAGAWQFRTFDPVAGRRLWASDGTPGAVELVAELDVQTSALLPVAAGLSVFGGSPVATCWAPVADGVFFAPSETVSGQEPWFSAGTAARTWLVEDLAPGPGGSGPGFCRPLAGSVVFAASSPESIDLYSSSGGVGKAEPLGLQVDGSSPAGTAYLDERLYGASSTAWRTDGTPAGTESLSSFFQAFPPEAESFGDRVYFGSDELFAVTVHSTQVELVADLNGDGLSLPARLTAFGSRLLFLAWEDDTGFELWSTRILPGGTSLVRDIYPGSASGFYEETWSEGRPFLSRIVPLGGIAVFVADDGVHGEELWTTDGTTAGTQLLVDLVPGAYPSSPRELVRLGDRVYFVAESPGLGRELWRTDGLPGGTELVADLVAGPGSALPEQLTVAGSELYFSAWTSGAGREPWRLRDVGASPTLLAPLADVAPGPLSSSPLAFLEVGGQVFFPANDNTLGFELWRVREPDAVFSDGFESSSTAVWSVAAP